MLPLAFAAAHAPAKCCFHARWPLLFALTPTVWEWERRHSFNCRNSNCAGVANCWISGAYRRLRDSRTEYTAGVRWRDGTYVCRGTLILSSYCGEIPEMRTASRL